MCCCAVKRIEMNYAKGKAENETEAHTLSLSFLFSLIHTNEMLDKEKFIMLVVKRECENSESGGK